MTDRELPARHTALSHEHAPRSMPNRQGRKLSAERLIYERSTATPKASKRRQPVSPNAAKYISAETKSDGAAVVAEDKTTIPQAQDHASHHKTDSSDTAKADKAADSGKTAAPGDTTSAPDTAASVKKADDSHGSAHSRKVKPRKLRFAEDEAAPVDKPVSSGKKLDKARHKAERSGKKLAKAHKNLPKKRRPAIKRSFDEKSQKTKTKFVFEEEVKSQREHIRGPLLTRPLKLGANAAIVHGHRKMYQVEHENVGTQAAHRAEMLVEGGLRSAYRLHKTAPYRKVKKLEAKTSKLNIKASYQQALHDNPKLKSNMFSRMTQKRKIQRDYAKATREAQKAGTLAKKTGDVIGKAGQAIVRTVARHPIVFGIIGGILLIMVIFSSLFTSCSNMGAGIGGTFTATSYLAQDADIDNAELYYTEWETDLQMQIGRTETDWPGYDEYRYQVGDISHNPYELMAYLTAVYQEFTYAGVESALRDIFAEQYQLTFIPNVETRYADPTDANDDGDYEPYDWNVLTVKLVSRSFLDVISPRMTAEQRQHYDLLMRTKGGRQYSLSPFDFNWLPNVTSYYGYRVHPITGAKDYHMGIDIAVPTGTDVRAGHDGTVFIGYDAGGYGHYVTLTGADGLVTKYAHLDSVIASGGQAVKAGDVIAKSGNSGGSTGPHLHFEVIKNGQYLNPIYFALTNDTGAPPVYGYAGLPMGDGSYAALIAEAEQFLGYPYVWGGSSPATSFDCSGFVCWTYTQSGVHSIPRTTAQGIYNLCTPVSPAEAQPGDLIFFTGTYSAPHPVTHVGIYVGNGLMLHCGDPIGYASINTSYWQSHFYSYGRIN